MDFIILNVKNEILCNYFPHLYITPNSERKLYLILYVKILILFVVTFLKTFTIIGFNVPNAFVSSVRWSNISNTVSVNTLYKDIKCVNVFHLFNTL